MAPDLIRIDTDSLSGLEGRIASLTANVMSSIESNFRGVPDVDHKYDDFVKRWDDNRKKLFDSLDNVGKTVQQIREAFETNDANLAKAVNGQA